MKFSLLPVVALTLAQGPAIAPLPPGPNYGVWSGTLGGKEVRLCLDGGGGHIYALGDSDIHELWGSDGSSLRDEWTSVRDANSNLGQLWIGPMNDGVSPIIRLSSSRPVHGTLRQIAPAEGGLGDCGSAEFMAPRFPQSARQVENLEMNGQKYAKVTYRVDPGYSLVSMVGAALDGSKPGDAAINARLEVEATSWGPGDDYRSCSNKNHSNSGAVGFEVSILDLTDRFVGVRRDYSGVCGGSWDSGEDFATYDRLTGKKVEVADWFRPEFVRVDRLGYATLAVPVEALRKVAQRSLVGNDDRNIGLAYDLSDEGNEMGPNGFEVFLHHDGIGFSAGGGRFPRGEVVVPWVRIKPFLKPEAIALIDPRS